MKKHLLTILAVSSCAVAATVDLSPAFHAKNVALPAVFFTVPNKQGPVTLFTAAEALSRITNSASAAHWKFVSKMPIISPNADLDTNMVKVPDSSIDYKLIVKAPDVESAK